MPAMQRAALLRRVGEVIASHAGELARIEVPAAAITRLAEESIRAGIAHRFTELGFRFVTLDLEGFRTGSMNELIPLDLRRQYSKTP